MCPEFHRKRCNSLYNWIKKDTTVCNNNKYLNSKIDFVIENPVIDCFNKKFKIYGIKKNVKNKLNVSLSYNNNGLY